MDTDTPDPADFDDRTKKSFDFLQDATKQLITLATAILTFTITFLKDVAKSAGDGPRTVITWSWIFLVASAVAGLCVLLSMTGVLGRPRVKADIYKGSIRILTLVQLVAFGAALILTLCFAIATSTPAP